MRRWIRVQRPLFSLCSVFGQEEIAIRGKSEATSLEPEEVARDAIWRLVHTILRLSAEVTRELEELRSDPARRNKILEIGILKSYGGCPQPSGNERFDLLGGPDFSALTSADS